MKVGKENKGKGIAEQGERDCFMKAVEMGSIRSRTRREKEGINIQEKDQRETKTKRRDQIDKEN